MLTAVPAAACALRVVRTKRAAAIKEPTALATEEYSHVMVLYLMYACAAAPTLGDDKTPRLFTSTPISALR